MLFKWNANWQTMEAQGICLLLYIINMVRPFVAKNLKKS
jgi:hypothetical protein